MPMSMWMRKFAQRTYVNTYYNIADEFCKRKVYAWVKTEAGSQENAIRRIGNIEKMISAVRLDTKTYGILPYVDVHTILTLMN